MRPTAPHTGLELLAPGLHATAPVPLPFMPGVDLRSFVVQAEDGPVVIYNTSALRTTAESIDDLGTPRRLLINHWHEGMTGHPGITAPVFVHERDRRQLEEAMPVAGTFQDHARIGDDLQVIPSLAHTPGATFYLWDSGEHRYLFVGDSFWVENRTWRAVLLGESDRAAFLTTLAFMQDLDFDVLVPWPAQHGQPALEPVTPTQKQQQLDALTKRLKAGATGPSS